MRPHIGVTPDAGTTTARTGRPPLPRYELKESYANAVLRAGGLPFVLPYSADEDAITGYLDSIRGLVITGGAFDVPPSEYGAPPSPKLGPTNPRRTQFERRLLEGALARRMPVLGICGGMQLLNVVMGGTLVQDIASDLPQAGAHEQPHDPREPAHPVTVEPGSVLSRATATRKLGVNSTHHQAVRNLGRNLVITGRAPDGMVEAIEVTSGFFALGVQWHPELLSDAPNAAIFDAFLAATRG